MRQYKIVASILLILSVSSFVLAAPFSGESVKSGSGKRAEVQGEEDPMKKWSDGLATLSQHQGSSLTSTYEIGSYSNPTPSPEGEANLIQLVTPDSKPALPGNAKSGSWADLGKVVPQSGGEIMLPLLPGVNTLPPPPGRKEYLDKMAAQNSPSPESEHITPSSFYDPSPPRRKRPALQSPAEIIFSKSKKYLKKFGKIKFW